MMHKWHSVKEFDKQNKSIQLYIKYSEKHIAQYKYNKPLKVYNQTS